MAHILFDDGLPEPSPQASITLWLDEADPRSRAAALEQARRLATASSAGASTWLHRQALGIPATIDLQNRHRDVAGDS